MKSPSRASWTIALALVAATFVAYLPVRDNGFVGFDDPRYLTSNEMVKQGLTLDGLAWAFTTTQAYNWHPLTWISHMTDVEAFGLAPRAHHLMSVGIHAANAVLLFVLLRTLRNAPWPSALVAFLFALHPLRVESVAWASERKDVLGGMLWLVTMILYVDYARRPRGTFRYASVVVAFTAGLMAKPMLVTLPFVLLLVDFWPLGRLRLGPLSTASAAALSSGPREPVPTGKRGSPRGGVKRRATGGGPSRRRAASAAGIGDRAADLSRGGGVVPLSRLLAEKLPLFLLAGAASAMTLRAQRGIVQSVESFPLASRIANAALSYVRYLGKMVWPADLAVFYPYRERSLVSGQVLAAFVLLAAITALAFALRRRGYPIVGWLWFLGTLVPVLGLVQTGIQSMADRYTYLPGIGLAIAVVWGAADALERHGLLRSAAGRRVVAAAAIALLAVLGSLTWRQAQTWHDDETLFAHAAATTPESYWASYNLGLTLLDGGRAGEAVPRFETAARLEPTSAEALVNLGRALERVGRMGEAIDAFQKARQTAPGDLAAARHASRALVSAGRPSEAAAVAEGATARWPEDPQLRYTLGLARLLLDRPAAAVEPLRRAVELDPAYAAAHNALGIALAREGDGAAAIEHFERAVELEPGYTEARENLARLRASLGGPPR